MPEGEKPRRGRPPRPVPLAPTGYRSSAAIRKQLLLAMAFLDEPTLQAVIDRAVRDFLAGLRKNVEGFDDAVVAVERRAAGEPGNVTHLRDKRG